MPFRGQAHRAFKFASGHGSRRARNFKAASIGGPVDDQRRSVLQVDRERCSLSGNALQNESAQPGHAGSDLYPLRLSKTCSQPMAQRESTAVRVPTPPIQRRCRRGGQHRNVGGLAGARAGNGVRGPSGPAVRALSRQAPLRQRAPDRDDHCDGHRGPGRWLSHRYWPAAACLVPGSVRAAAAARQYRLRDAAVLRH